MGVFELMQDVDKDLGNKMPLAKVVNFWGGLREWVNRNHLKRSAFLENSVLLKQSQD